MTPRCRAISFDYRDLDSAERARDEIVLQIKAVEKNPKDVDTPLTHAIELQSLRRSGNPLEKSAADIMAMLQDLKTGLNDVQRNMKRDTSADVIFLDPAFGANLSGVTNLSGVSQPRPDDVNPGHKLYIQRLTSAPPPKTGKDKKE